MEIVPIREMRRIDSHSRQLLASALPASFYPRTLMNAYLLFLSPGISAQRTSTPNSPRNQSRSRRLELDTLYSRQNSPARTLRMRSMPGNGPALLGRRSAVILFAHSTRAISHVDFSLLPTAQLRSDHVGHVETSAGMRGIHFRV